MIIANWIRELSERARFVHPLGSCESKAEVSQRRRPQK